MLLAALALVRATAGGFELPGLWSLTYPGALLGLAVFVIVSIVRGWLIPKSTHEREVAAANQRTLDAKERGDEWKSTALEYRGVLDRKELQVDTLVKTNAVIQDVLREASPTKLSDTEPRGGG